MANKTHFYHLRNSRRTTPKSSPRGVAHPRRPRGCLISCLAQIQTKNLDYRCIERRCSANCLTRQASACAKATAPRRKHTRDGWPSTQRPRRVTSWRLMTLTGVSKAATAEACSPPPRAFFSKQPYEGQNHAGRRGTVLAMTTPLVHARYGRQNSR